MFKIFLKKLIPQSWQKQLTNFYSLAFLYGQWSTIKNEQSTYVNLDPIPWYTYPAIEYLSNIDFGQMNVFEFGSGNSSLFWAKIAKQVTSVEHDKDWYEKILPLKPANLNLVLKVEKNDYISSLLSFEKPQLIIIDGMHREECTDLIISSHHLTQDAVIIFDNSDWYPQCCKRLKDELDLIQVDFHGFGPINDYTWTTSILFSRHTNLKPLNDLQPHRSKAGITI